MKIANKLVEVPLPNDEFLKSKFAPPVYICHRAKGKPTIDGDVFKPFWDHAPRTQPFRDIEGACRPAPAKETWAKLLWDDENLYIAAILYGEEIFAYVTERDDIIFHDNDFEFFLDRENTTQNYFEFEMNALNTVWDLILPKSYLNGGTPLDGFNFNGMETAVKIQGELNKPNPNNEYWSLEIKIPWKSIAKHGSASDPPVVGDYYRFNFSRVQWQVEVKDGQYTRKINPETNRPYPEDNWVYAPTGVVNIHYPELWAFLVFADDAAATFEIPRHEYVKWELRKEYYAQRAHYARHNLYTPQVLTQSNENIKVETTVSTFQAYVVDGNKRINIAHDGYTWMEEIT